MKKQFYVLLIALSMLIMTACGNNTNSSNADSSADSSDNARLDVVTSFYPIYYMTKAIGGEQVNVTNLIATGVEPHDWSPKSKDLLTATEADLLLYHGVGLETWIDSFINGLEKNSKVVIKEVSSGIELIDASGETSVNDNEAQSDHSDHDHGNEAHSDHADHDHAQDEAHSDHDHDHDHDHGNEAHSDHGHSHTIDPHTWVSPKSALIIANNIKDSLVEVDGDNAAVYEQNFNHLQEQLQELDTQYTEQLANLPLRTIVVSHQSFGYVARDYQLQQISIMGLSPSAEPRAQDIKNIANLVKESGVKVIFFEELVSDNLAKMLASEAKVETNVIYSLEGLTSKQENSGENYLTLMERNLQNIVEALQ